MECREGMLAMLGISQWPLFSKAISGNVPRGGGGSLQCPPHAAPGLLLRDGGEMEFLPSPMSIL